MAAQRYSVTPHPNRDVATERLLRQLAGGAASSAPTSS